MTITNKPEIAPTVRIVAPPGVKRKYESSKPPAVLCSFLYLDNLVEFRKRYPIRDWALDSGAFTALTCGKTVDLVQYTETCLEFMKTDPALVEIFALDVIGDWRATLKNAEYMWEHGVPAIPCFHHGEPLEALKHLAKNYPKIALGGVALRRGPSKMDWATWCFSQVWPKKIHGFGFGTRNQVLGLPWHSVDASSWITAPCCFGRWDSYDMAMFRIRGQTQNLRSEIEMVLKTEALARIKWKREMQTLNTKQNES